MPEHAEVESTERYNEAAIALVTRIVLTHTDEIRPGWIVCTCGDWSVKGSPIGAIAAAQEFFRHRSEAILIALADAGLLVRHDDGTEQK